MKDQAPEPEKAERPRTTTEKEGKPTPESTPAKPKYEFKILPVDPKNSFDFEDVADK